MQPDVDVTMLLRAWREGDPRALDALIPLVHGELRHLARRYMPGERPDHTLQTTALINETFLKLVGARRVQWQDRAHFFSVSARLMRRVLVDHARERLAKKRGAGAERVALEDATVVVTGPNDALIALDEALSKLERVDPRRSHVIELRFFGGLTVQEAAEVLHVSADTIKRDWRLAKAWLARELDRLSAPQSAT